MKTRQHWYCPKAKLREVKSRNKIKLLRPMGKVRAVYVREGSRWVRVGKLCLDCLLFEPSDNFQVKDKL